MNRKPVVGDIVKLNANGHARLHATGNHQTMMITHVQDESITSPEETYIVRVDNEINRYLLDHHMFDVVGFASITPLEKWRTYIAELPGASLLAHAVGSDHGYTTKRTLDDLNLDVPEDDARRVIFAEVDARWPPRHRAQTPSTANTVTCGVCGGGGHESHVDGVGGKWTETCSQCRGRGKVRVMP